MINYVGNPAVAMDLPRTSLSRKPYLSLRVPMLGGVLRRRPAARDVVYRFLSPRFPVRPYLSLSVAMVGVDEMQTKNIRHQTRASSVWSYGRHLRT